MTVLTSRGGLWFPASVAASVTHVQRVHGVVQRYAWGDPTFIPSLLGVEPDGEPWAELWLGTHPNGPARSTTAARSATSPASSRTS